MNKILKQNRFKIVLVLILSLLTAQLLVQSVFIAGTPRTKPALISRSLTSIKELWTGGYQFLSGLFKKQSPSIATGPAISPLVTNPEQALKDVPFQTVAKGVYAKTNNTASYTLVKVNETTWKNYTFTIKGKTVTVKVPAGQNPPTDQQVQSMY